MFEDALEPPLAEQSMTRRALAVLGFARDEAIALNHHYVGTEHLLLGLMRDTNSHAGRVLATETGLESAREQVRKLVGRGQEVPKGNLPLTLRASRVLHFARREADLYQAKKIAPEHLLGGILREDEGLAMQVLLALDVDITLVRGAALPGAD